MKSTVMCTFKSPAIVIALFSAALSIGAEAAPGRIERSKTDIRANENREVTLDAKARRSALSNVEAKNLAMRAISLKNLKLAPTESFQIAMHMLESSDYIAQVRSILSEAISADEMVLKIRELNASSVSGSKNQRFLTDRDIKTIMNPARFKLIESAGISYYESVDAIGYESNLVQFIHKLTLNPSFSDEPNDLTQSQATAGVTETVSVRFDSQIKLDEANPLSESYAFYTSLVVDLVEREVTYDQASGVIAENGNSRGKVADPVGLAIKLKIGSYDNISRETVKSLLQSQISTHLANLPSSITAIRKGETSAILGQPTTRADGAILLKISSQAKAVEVKRIINEFATTR